MYTATLESTEVKKEQGKIDATVSFTDGENTFSKVFSVGLRSNDVESEVKRQVKHFVEGLENADSKVVEVARGELDISRVPSTVETQGELDRTAWMVKYYRLVGATKMVELGIFPDTLSEYVALKENVRDTFLPSYVNFI